MIKDGVGKRGRSFMAAGVILATSVGLAACGGLDTGEVEDIFQGQVETLIEQSGSNVTIESVSCPDDISSETGTTFECTAELSDGSSISNTGEVAESEGNEASVEFPADTIEGQPAPDEGKGG